MKRERPLNALLMELMLAVLFFALCATVLLRCYAATGEMSRRAQTDIQLLTECRSTAERLTAAEDPMAALTGEGFAPDPLTEDLWVREADGVTCTVSMIKEDTGAGTLYKGSLQAAENGRTVVSLPWAAYRAKEGEKHE